MGEPSKTDTKPKPKFDDGTGKDSKLTIGKILSEMGFSLETHAIDGKEHPEIELTIYAEMVDLSDLDKANRVLEIEQWEMPRKEGCDGKLRIREINGREWVQTSKRNPFANNPGVREVENMITKDMFDFMKYMAMEGRMKKRYIYNIPNTGLIWEVDVFTSMDGTQHPWVKIDLEVPDEDIELPPWPFRIKDDFIIEGADGNQYTDKVLIKRLWDDEWSRLDDPYTKK